MAVAPEREYLHPEYDKFEGVGRVVKLTGSAITSEI